MLTQEGTQLDSKLKWLRCALQLQFSDSWPSIQI